MKRSETNRKVVDLGKASRETKGGTIGVPDFLGQYAPLGLTKD
ncbi:MAG: benenodin family lasso peptide [Sphingomonas sp.]